MLRTLWTDWAEGRWPLHFTKEHSESWWGPPQSWGLTSSPKLSWPQCGSHLLVHQPALTEHLLCIHSFWGFLHNLEARTPTFWKRKLRSNKIYLESTGHNGNSYPMAAMHKLHWACRHGVGTKPQEMPWPVVAVTSRKGKIRKTLLSNLNEPVWLLLNWYLAVLKSITIKPVVDVIHKRTATWEF